MVSTNTERLLHEELGWPSLSTRRQLHKVKLFHKIVNKNAPEYLQRLLPSSTPQGLTRQTRNERTLNSFRCRTSKYAKSFFPSTTLLWNSLPSSISSISSTTAFRSAIKSYMIPSKPPSFYGCGMRKMAIIHTRLRLGHCGLNVHLNRIGVVESPLCPCDRDVETVAHFILNCASYDAARRKMLSNIHSFVFPTFNVFRMLHHNSSALLKLLLCGSSDLSETCNVRLFTEVYDFIDTTRRFSND